MDLFIYIVDHLSMLSKNKNKNRSVRWSYENFWNDLQKRYLCVCCNIYKWSWINFSGERRKLFALKQPDGEWCRLYRIYPIFRERRKFFSLDVVNRDCSSSINVNGLNGYFNSLCNEKELYVLLVFFHTCIKYN